MPSRTTEAPLLLIRRVVSSNVGNVRNIQAAAYIDKRGYPQLYEWDWPDAAREWHADLEQYIGKEDPTKLELDGFLAHVNKAFDTPWVSTNDKELLRFYKTMSWVWERLPERSFADWTVVKDFLLGYHFKQII